MNDYLWTLEYAVLTESPRSLELSCEERTPKELTEALVLACRFRGLEHVKVLVESGATFTGSDSYYTAVLDVSPAFKYAYHINDPCRKETVTVPGSKPEMTLSVLPSEERAKVAKYICENSELLEFCPGELLYYSIMSNSREITAVLKEMGVSLSEKRLNSLTEKGQKYAVAECAEMLGMYDGKVLAEVLQDLAAELGGKRLRFGSELLKRLYDPEYDRYLLLEPEVFGRIIESFDHRQMNKMKIMKYAVDRDSVKCLALCAQNGWIDQPARRDELTAYAADNKKTECTAWLLNFKERNFDLAAERAKAEKRTERELNAALDSVTVLRKIWNWKKQEDGTLVITGYKGRGTAVAVPSRIGKSTVTAIGANAFSPKAPRTSEEQKANRAAITSVKLPDGIRVIGEEAFFCCEELSEINIPEGVTDIGEHAFWRCGKLAEITVPDSVVTMGKEAFSECRSLRSVRLPENLETLSRGVFSHCENLPEIKLPSALKYIKGWAFMSCQSFKELVIPEGVVEISWDAFADCFALETVVLPATVTAINTIVSKTDGKIFVKAPARTTFIVERGSFPEEFCRKNNIKFRYA